MTKVAQQSVDVEKARLADRLQSLLQALPAGVVVLDGRGRVQQANSAAARLLGEPLVGVLWRDVITRAFDTSAQGPELVLRTGYVVSLSTCPLGSEPGQILLLHDVTETRRLEERLVASRRLSDMGQMAANLAHQIRTPLASALLYASQLTRPGLSGEKRAEFATRTVARLKDLERLIGDMLAFARGELSGKDELQPLTLLHQVVSGLAGQTGKVAVSVASGDGTSRIWIRGNPHLLHTALQNLATNALQAMEQGGQLELRVEEVSDGVDLIVTDNGPGIPEMLQQRIFEPFETTRSSGTGLGLAVVRAIARGHGGEVWLKSRSGEGSTFGIRLPVYSREDVACNQR